jgi:2-polyprenyl-6-methoxyphenol hydroxylase-like FAD-dependent oxidoreductase
MNAPTGTSAGDRARSGAAPAPGNAESARRRALVVGLGIGGMSAALGLTRAGWDVQIVERAEERRTGGYFIGLSKEGFEAARYLGVADALRTHTPERYNTWEIDPKSRRRKGMSFTEQPNHPEVVLRGDIEEALWSGIEEQGVPVRFSTLPVTIGTNAELANVRLHCTATGEVTDETFDLVVGADGLRSSVRRQVFGPDGDFLEPLDRIICAFQLSEAPPNTSATDGLIIAEEKRSLWIFPFSDQPPTALFTYIPDDVDAQFRMNRGDALRQAYAGMNGDGVVQWALDQFDQAPNFLFDSRRFPREHRVAELLDAAGGVQAQDRLGAHAQPGLVLVAAAAVERRIVVGAGPVAEVVPGGVVHGAALAAQRLTRVQAGHADVCIERQEHDRVAALHDALSPSGHRPREHPRLTRREHLLHEGEAVGRRALRRERRVGGHPEVVVGVGVGDGPSIGQGAAQRRGPRAARAKDMEAAAVHGASLAHGGGGVCEDRRTTT